MTFPHQEEILDRLEDVMKHKTLIDSNSDLPELAHEEIIRLQNHLDAIFERNARCDWEDRSHGHWCECFAPKTAEEREVIYRRWMGIYPDASRVNGWRPAWRDPKPYLNSENGDRYAYEDAWPAGVDLDLLPRTQADYEKQTSSDAGSES